MPPEKKSSNWKPVDDTIAPADAVVRLIKDQVTVADDDIVRLEDGGTRIIKDDIIREEEIMRLEKDEVITKVVRERVKAPPTAEARLEVPDHSETETKRSFEPDVDVIMDTPAADPAAGEAVWGETKSRHPLPWGWFVLLGLAIAGAAAWSVRSTLDARKEISKEQEQIVEALTESDTTNAELADNMELLEAALRAFCEAGDMDQLAAQVRQRERVWPLMQDHYRREPFKPLGYQRQRSIQAAMLDSGKSFWIASVVIGGGVTKSLLAEEVAPGSFKVDWETAVTFQPMPWDEYAIERPTDSTLDFRVVAKIDSFHSHEFADSGQWSSYMLTVPDCEQFLWGYTRRGSKEDEILRNAMGPDGAGSRPASVVLRLHLPSGLASRRGVLIDKVLSTRWAYIVPPE